MTFYDEEGTPTNRLSIRQQFYGLDTNDVDKSDRINVTIELEGSIPNIDADAKVYYRSYKQEYKHIRRGILK